MSSWLVICCLKNFPKSQEMHEGKLQDLSVKKSLFSDVLTAIAENFLQYNYFIDYYLQNIWE